jgi:hypothetical protein
MHSNRHSRDMVFNIYFLPRPSPPPVCLITRSCPPNDMPSRTGARAAAGSGYTPWAQVRGLPRCSQGLYNSASRKTCRAHSSASLQTEQRNDAKSWLGLGMACLCFGGFPSRHKCQGTSLLAPKMHSKACHPAQSPQGTVGSSPPFQRRESR